MFDNNWKDIMLPIPYRISLDAVADWYWQTVNWRVRERDAGRGTPYDADEKSCVNRGMVLMKFPWLSIRDFMDLAAVIHKAKARNRDKCICDHSRHEIQQ